MRHAQQHLRRRRMRGHGRSRMPRLDRTMRLGCYCRLLPSVVWVLHSRHDGRRKHKHRDLNHHHSCRQGVRCLGDPGTCARGSACFSFGFNCAICPTPLFSCSHTNLLLFFSLSLFYSLAHPPNPTRTRTCATTRVCSRSTLRSCWMHQAR